MPESRPLHFPTTEWSMILAAGSDGSLARPALERLCRKYWWPLFGFARRAGLSREAGEDAVQAYLLTVIERGSLTGVARGEARFRSWLLGGLEHAMANLHRHNGAQKRGGGQEFFPLDETREVPAWPGLSAAEAYDRQWAQTVMLAAMRRLREEQSRAGKNNAYAMLEPVVTGQEKTAYALLAVQLGTTENNVAIMIHRLRTRLRDILRAEVAQTVASPEDLEDELRYLFAIAGGN